MISWVYYLLCATLRLCHRQPYSGAEERRRKAARPEARRRTARPALPSESCFETRGFASQHEGGGGPPRRLPIPGRLFASSQTARPYEDLYLPDNRNRIGAFPIRQEFV